MKLSIKITFTLSLFLIATLAMASGLEIERFDSEFFIKFFKDGGKFMYPIAFFLAFGAAVIAHKTFFLIYFFKVDARWFIQEITHLVKAGKVKEARLECDNMQEKPVARVVGSGLELFHEDPEEIKSGMDEAYLDVSPKVTKGISYLSMIANIATLLGLLGTIVGLISAFSAVAKADPAQRQMVLTASIAIAMNCTAFGLITAIIMIVSHSFLSNMAQKILDDIEMCQVAVINLSKKLGKGPAGSEPVQLEQARSAGNMFDPGNPGQAAKAPPPPPRRKAG